MTQGGLYEPSHEGTRNYASGCRSRREGVSAGPPRVRWHEVFTFYYFTSVIVIVGVVFAVDFVPPYREHPGSKTRVDLLSAFAAWDGEWYGRIAATGYSYDPDRPSAVAFFPLYPILAGALVQTTGMPTEWALLLVSQGALVATFALLAAYVRQRAAAAEDELPGWTLLAFGLFPTTFFFRMAYTESLFMMLMLIALLGMERGWRPVWIALVIGAATGTRSVAVALVPVFAMYLWRRMRSEEAGQENGLGGLACRQWLAWSARVSVLLPACCWGLLAYMAFLWFVFGEPLAFVKTQSYWTERSMDLGQRVLGLLTLEPLRATYDPSGPCYWGRVPPRGNPLFNLKAANPVYFLAAVALIALGARKRWLTAPEVLLSMGLLGIPYCLQASRMGMTGQARFAAVVFPVYLVLGQLLQRMPAPLAAALLAISGLFLAVYSAMFASWYWFF